ncbi:MAG: hypothetical protein GY720_13960 [bacterium]|nr:hypothetical protein [bacterium]
MGQQPNLELGPDDLPRAKASPGSARRWRPSRPGELIKIADIPSGGPFGVAGPDAGYALKLVEERDLELLPGEHHHDVAVALAALATARAGEIGRGPIADDVAVGMVILGFDSETETPAALLERRPGWVAGLGHNAAKLRRLVADVPADLLALPPDGIRQQVAAGWAFRG